MAKREGPLRAITIPEEALDIAGTPGHCALLFAIYRRAYASRWRPFTVSMNILSAESGLAKVDVMRALDTLERSGLLARDRGGRAEQDVIHALDPALIPEDDA
jgi:hypothetical protein